MTCGLKAGEKLVIASHNAGKVKEISALLAPYRVNCISAGELNLPEPEETGATFVANAELKAVAAATASGFPALADDSGLCVNGLGGDPGIYSARWAGPERDFGLAMEKVNRALRNARTDDRSAYFVCVLSLAWPDGNTMSFEGRITGALCWPPRGTKGFGYDPVFIPDGYDETFGEMDQDEKHRISHRADAFEKFVSWAFEEAR